MDTFHSKPRQDFETRLSIHINHPEDLGHNLPLSEGELKGVPAQ